LRVISKVGHPNARLLIDALHLDRSGGTPEQVAEVDPEQIAYVHLCDAPQGPPASLTEESRRGRLYPGEGTLPLQRLFDLLPKDVSVSLEAPHALHADLPPRERLALAGEATLRFMKAARARHDAARSLTIEG
jgi:sugar phosphate isomerase/epimerase